MRVFTLRLRSSTGWLSEKIDCVNQFLTSKLTGLQFKFSRITLQVAMLHQRRKRLSASLDLLVTDISSQPDVSPIIRAGINTAQRSAWERNRPTSSEWHTECEPRSEPRTGRWKTAWKSCRRSERWCVNELSKRGSFDRLEKGK